jgi:uncharacterized membrane protein YfcA
MDALLATAVDPTTLAILGVIFGAVIVRSALGFGDVLVSVPILVLFVDPRLVIPLMGMVGATNALLLLIRERSDVQWRPVRYLLMASVFGVPIGVWLLTWVSPRAINVSLGVMLVLFCAWSLTGRRSVRLMSPVWALPFGFGAGLMGGAVTATGPPIVLYSTTQDWVPEQRRATMQGFFLPNGLFILVFHFVAGLWTPEVLQTYVLSIPVCLMALPVGGFVASRLSRGRFEFLTFVVLLLTGVLLLVG